MKLTNTDYLQCLYFQSIKNWRFFFSMFMILLILSNEIFFIHTLECVSFACDDYHINILWAEQIDYTFAFQRENQTIHWTITCTAYSAKTTRANACIFNTIKILVCSRIFNAEHGAKFFRHSPPRSTKGLSKLRRPVFMKLKPLKIHKWKFEHFLNITF